MSKGRFKLVVKENLPGEGAIFRYQGVLSDTSEVTDWPQEFAFPAGGSVDEVIDKAKKEIALLKEKERIESEKKVLWFD